MPSKVNSATLIGIRAIPILVEVDAAMGLPNETIVGLPDLVVRESRNRIRSAIKHSGFEYPLRSYTINLAPAEIRKEGPLLDLAIAFGILQATQQLPRDQSSFFVGELSLDGTLNPIRGILSICHELAQKFPDSPIFIPVGNYPEAQLSEAKNIIPLQQLSDLRLYYSQTYVMPQRPATQTASTSSTLDFAEVKGQAFAKRALEIAAAGHHHLLMAGPPGSGKSMLAKRLPSIMPMLSTSEMIETQKIRSLISGRTGEQATLSYHRPFRSPHHTISYAGMAGGGSPPLPGEISLAHHGILFLDEFPEFPRRVIEALRQPLEDREIVLSRANLSVAYPADFMLVAAMNPCPCGYFGDTKNPCRCTPFAVQLYGKRISGPILDRFDLKIEVPRLKDDDFFQPYIQETPSISKLMQSRVIAARSAQVTRQGAANSRLSPREIDRYCQLSTHSQLLLKSAIQKGMISARSFHRILRVARTIADLEGESSICEKHVAEALQLRRQ